MDRMLIRIVDRLKIVNLVLSEEKERNVKSPYSVLLLTVASISWMSLTQLGYCCDGFCELKREIERLAA
jgi:hypothetical protein